MEVKLNQEISQSRHVEYIIVDRVRPPLPSHLNYPQHLVKCFDTAFSDKFISAPADEWGSEVGDWTGSDGEYYAQNAAGISSELEDIPRTTLPNDLDNFILYVNVNFCDTGGVLLRSTGTAGILLLFDAGNISFRVLDGFSKISEVPDSVVVSEMYDDDDHELLLKIIVNGPKYDVYIKNANQPFLSLTDSTYTSGKVALVAMSEVRFGEIELKPGLKITDDRSSCYQQKNGKSITRDLIDPTLVGSVITLARRLFLDLPTYNLFKISRDVLTEVEAETAVVSRDIVVFISKVFDDGEIAVIADHLINSSKILPLRINENTTR